jgi:hypothetical protein
MDKDEDAAEIAPEDFFSYLASSDQRIGGRIERDLRRYYLGSTDNRETLNIKDPTLITVRCCRRHLRSPLDPGRF